jgi:2-polyprenyl-3-methyl-5-hydroxy-6-metoxy-1,4-benzoquinol methylase
MVAMGETSLGRLRVKKIASGAPGAMPACPVCNGGKTEPIVQHSDFDGVSLFRCVKCSHHFAYPEPDSAQLAAYYRRGYRRYRSGPSYCELMRRRAYAQVQFIKKHLLAPDESLAEWKVCDLGCGMGALVAQLEREGALAKGYDLDPSLIRLGRKLWKSDLGVGGLEAANGCGQLLDLLCFSHVIEHLPDIRRSMSKALHGLRDGGHLFLEVPNCQGKTFSSSLDFESHLHFFTPRSLTALLEGLGLSVITSATCGPVRQLIERKGPDSASKFRLILNRALFLLKKRDHIKTLYDGFYETYDRAPEAGGIWIRCLATKKEEKHGSAGPHSR